MKDVMKLLTKAFMNRFDMSEEDASSLAKIVQGVFDGRKEIEDSLISKEIRALFYELENNRLLKVRREEQKRGKLVLRRYYWSMNYEIIRRAANGKKEDEVSRLYAALPRRAWSSRSYFNN